MAAIATRSGDARASFARALAETPKPVGREEEVALARRIEDAELALLLHQLRRPHGTAALTALRDALESGEVRVGKVLRDLDVDDPAFEEASVTLRALAALDAIKKSRHADAIRAADISRATMRRLTTKPDDPRGEALAREVQRTKNELLRANIRLVASLARRAEFEGRGLDLLDLIQEGTLGMMSAVDNFDWRRGFKFSTYGTWWIRQALQRAVVEHSRTIRLPFGIAELLSKIGREKRRSLARDGRESTDEELACELGVTVERIRVALDSARVEPRSLQTPVGEDGQLEDLLSDDNAILPDEAASALRRAQSTVTALATLAPREQHILRLRFGLDDQKEHTLQEIADELGLTRERIRQIEKRAVSKLKTVFSQLALNDG